MELTRAYCLHGFLGLPSDWTLFTGAWRDEKEAAVEITAPDLFADPNLGMQDNCAQWAKRFCRQVGSEKAGSGRVLIGYSLGGRLALHALREQPELWNAAVIVSAHPGLPSAERMARRCQAARWAVRALEEPWDIFLHHWERQPVFGERPAPFCRREKDYSRAKLAAALWAWSLGNQEDLLEGLPPIPVLWVAGNEDSKYSEIAQQAMARCLSIQASILPHAGHRAPWENPGVFIEQVQRFLNQTLFWRGARGTAWERETTAYV